MKERIKVMLGNGLSPSVTALACGCTPAYVSQLLAEEQFAAEVAELRFASISAATDRDVRTDKIEDALLAKLEELLPYMTKPMEVVRTYMAINGAKRRGAPISQELPQTTQVIQLFLPPQVVNNFKLSKTNEVVEVDNRTLVSMQAPKLLESLKAKIGGSNELLNKDEHSERTTVPATKDNSIAASLI